MVEIQAINILPTGGAPRTTPAARPAEGEAGRQPPLRGLPGGEGSAALPVAPRLAQEVQEEAGREGSTADLQKALEESVQELNEFVRPYNTNLFFSIERDLARVIVQVKDRETDEVIKQIPSEEAVALAKALDKLKGLLVHQEA
ncbi:MAG: flagellar protein FlaG [Zoogloeaceae bacterium]|jgi:flagellar protein FlaG|nr:flagellar protein FlaG [Zoogloeaceae bacterium]